MEKYKSGDQTCFSSNPVVNLLWTFVKSYSPRKDPDNHDGVITHLEPDILECEAKWA